jgi:hypothetical protein
MSGINPEDFDLRNLVTGLPFAQRVLGTRACRNLRWSVTEETGSIGIEGWVTKKQFDKLQKAIIREMARRNGGVVLSTNPPPGGALFPPLDPNNLPPRPN